MEYLRKLFSDLAKAWKGAQIATAAVGKTEEDILREKVRATKQAAKDEGLHDLVQWMGQNAKNFERWKKGGQAEYLSPIIKKVSMLKPDKTGGGKRERIEIQTEKGKLMVIWWEEYISLPDGDSLDYRHYQINFDDAESVRVKYEHNYDMKYDVTSEVFKDFHFLKRGPWIDAAKDIHYWYKEVLNGKMTKRADSAKAKELLDLQQNFDV